MEFFILISTPEGSQMHRYSEGDLLEILETEGKATALMNGNPVFHAGAIYINAEAAANAAAQDYLENA